MGSSFILAENEWKELLRKWQSVPRSPNLNEAHSHPEGGNAGRRRSDGTSVFSDTGSTGTFPPLSRSSPLTAVSRLHSFVVLTSHLLFHLSPSPLFLCLPIFFSSHFSLPLLPYSHPLFHYMNVSLLLSFVSLSSFGRFVFICSLLCTFTLSISPLSPLLVFSPKCFRLWLNPM